MPDNHPYSSIRSSSRFGAAALGLMTLCMLAVSAPAALVRISNTTSDDESGAINGGYAFVNESGLFLQDPPAKIFIGGFDGQFTSIPAITQAFSNNFATLASNFDSIADVTLETDVVGGIQGIHDSATSGGDPTSVEGRAVAVWISTTGDYTQASGEHLIYVTTGLFDLDPPPPFPEESYSVLLRPSSDGGNGTLAVGGFSNYFNDFGFGAGNQGAFNTVAIPEPGSVLLLTLAGAAGFVFYRRKHARGSGVRG